MKPMEAKNFLKLQLFLMFACCGFLGSTTRAAVIYHSNAPTFQHIYEYHAVPVGHNYHAAYTIVAPLTKLAHVTYDSVPISHSQFEHVPLFQRVGHVKSWHSK